MTGSRMPPDMPPIPPASAPRSAPMRAAAAPGWERQALEKLLHATLAEQRTARRWRVGLHLLWLAVTVLIFTTVVTAVFTSGGSAGPPARSLPHTAVIELRGEIAAGTGASAQRLVAALQEAFENSKASAVVLLINSPGGSPVQSGIVHDEIRRLRAEYDKPLYAVVEEMCASGAYYIAAAADEIFVDKASIVGSIGVLMNGFGFTGAMEKLGVERRLLTAGENKGFLDPFSPMDEQQRVFAQNMLGEIHQQFIDVVRNGRGSRLKESADMFSGLFWTGQQAVKMGLADHLGSLDHVARTVVAEEELVDYTRRDSLADLLAREFGVSIGQGLGRMLQTSARMPELK